MVLMERFKLYFILCVWNIEMAATSNNNDIGLPPPGVKISMLRSMIDDVFNSEFPNLDKSLLKKLLNEENDESIKIALGLSPDEYNSTVIKQAIITYIQQIRNSKIGGRRKHRTRRNKKQRKHRSRKH
jgi:hypothetical protein